MPVSLFKAEIGNGIPLGSLVSGLAPNFGLLVAARALQGFGGGIALPLSTAMLFTTFEEDEQGRALGIFGMVMIVAPALGPILGGLLTDANLWRWWPLINNCRRGPSCNDERVATEGHPYSCMLRVKVIAGRPISRRSL
jgi:MFS family permease